MNKQKKVMIADDDEGIVDCIGIMLEFAGYDVKKTMDGNSILDMQEMPDLLLLDIWMSGVDGRDICRKLKQNDRTSKLPIVLVSASKDIQASALAAGADDFLAKPFEMNDLLEKIERNLNPEKLVTT